MYYKVEISGVDTSKLKTLKNDETNELLRRAHAGDREARKEGVYGYWGKPLAIMVRFPGQLFDTTPPPMALLNQSFLIIVSVVIILISIQIWKRRRI